MHNTRCAWWALGGQCLESSLIKRLPHKVPVTVAPVETERGSWLRILTSAGEGLARWHWGTSFGHWLASTTPAPYTWPASVMARGYQDQDQGSDYRPSRPARRVESLRGGVSNPGFSAHYAESPVIQTDSHPRSLPRTRPRSQGRSGTLPRSEARSHFGWFSVQGYTLLLFGIVQILGPLKSVV